MRQVYYPLYLLILDPLEPVSLNEVLPRHLVTVTGIRALHAAGAETKSNTPNIPVMGHLSLSFNHQQYHFGTIDIGMDNRPAISDTFWACHIPIAENSLMTGCYENKWNQEQTADGSMPAGWTPYIVTIYLKALSND